MKIIKNVAVGYATMEDDNNQRLRQLIEAEWDLIARILYSRTKTALYKRRFRGEWNGAIPGGHEVADFIQAAISEACCGLPHWDGGRTSLIKSLFKIILRHINRYASRAEAGRELRSTTDPAEANGHVADVSNAEQGCYEEPEEFASGQEGVEEILRNCRGKRDYRIIEVIVREGLHKPADIAKRLGLSVGEVNNAKRRLRRDPYMLSLWRRGGGGNRPDLS